MARRYEIITELYQRTIAALAEQQQWQRFLNTACYNFRLPFDEQVLLFAQRPDATAVLPIEGPNGWNQRFGRWVNRGSTGIAVFDSETRGRVRLKYYFDIADTHPSRFARPVPIWNVQLEYSEAIIEALENSFGDLENKDTLAAALISAAHNAAEDNVTDYLAELEQYKSGSNLEYLDSESTEALFKPLLQDSIAYMLLTRCGIDPGEHIKTDNLAYIGGFNTRETLNALGAATSDISQMCLSVISRTVLTLQRQAEMENRTFAENTQVQYDDAVRNNIPPERSERHEQSDILDAGRLSPAQPAAAPGGGSDPWEIRPAAPELLEAEPQSDLYQSADIGQADRASAGDPEDSPGAVGEADPADGEVPRRDGADEGRESDAVGPDDEQPPAVSGGDNPAAVDLQLSDVPGAGESGLPAFTDEKLIMAVISNRDDDLVYKKQQIELFFSLYPDQAERIDYIKTAYHIRFTEMMVDGVRIGYRPQSNGLLMWEGPFLSRTSESVFSWDCIAEWTGQLIDKKEYFIDTKIRPPKNYDSQQLSLYDLPEQDMDQISFMPRFQFPQQIIDEALCIGANDRNSRVIICAYFMKDHPLEQNAAFLQKHYKTNGAGFYVDGKQYALWYDQEGMRISSGTRVHKNTATFLSWEDAAKRIRELLDLGRYMPKEELDRAEDFELHELANMLSYEIREFTEAAEQAGYAPTLRGAYSNAKVYPAVTEQIMELLRNPESLQKVIDEWTVFCDAYAQNRALFRFHHHDPKEQLQQLLDLQREPVIFHATEDHPQRQYYISDDEIDKLLRWHQDYRLSVYSFFSTHPDNKDREKCLKNLHGEYHGTASGNDDYTFSRGAGLSFSHGSITEPYAAVKLNWGQITKRTSAMVANNTWLSEADRAELPEYERKQLALRIYCFFWDAPSMFPHPYQSDGMLDQWKAVAEIQKQLTDPAQVERIYQEMMLPLWESTTEDFRHYDRRKEGIAAIREYRDGTFSVFGRSGPLEPLAAMEPKVDALEESKSLINAYCQEEFDQDAEYGDLTHVDLAFGATSDSAHQVEIFADLTAFRLVYQVDKQTVHEIVCADLDELNVYLANLDFDRMIADAELQYTEQVQAHDGADHIAPTEEVSQEAQPQEDVPATLAPPKPRRERVEFAVLHPEIPAGQRHSFHITDNELGHGTRGEKYAANVAAIRTLKRIEAEERLATPEEQEILSRYVGWGGLADCFDDRHSKYQELKFLLDEEEYAAARASSLTAFYTSPVIIHAMYDALGRMGFQAGNILEPSCGVGNFIGMLPQSMDGCKVYGVELDSISGRIAQQLYQNSSIAVTGFEKVQMPDSFFDVAVGNVPFGDFKVRDRQYDKNHWLIHDYFFGKALDKVRPGGVIAFITSKGTMDKENSAVRKYLAQRADLIGAIRLPNTAFKANAGTEVTSDIIFLQKRDRMVDIEPDWVHLDTDANGIRMNSYFVQHPEMVLGDMVMESTQYGMDSTCKPYEHADLAELLSDAVQNLHAQITDYEVEELDEEDKSIPADPTVRNFSYTIVDGSIYFRENSRMHPVEVSATAESRIRGMIALRDQVRKVIEYQTENYEDWYIQKEQEKLNTLYDQFEAKYGRINSRGNSLAFSEDSGYYLLCSLEVLDDEGNFLRKADMFSKRTIRPHEAVTSVDTASEALAVSISEKARVDMEYMSELSGKAAEELETELSGVIFRDIHCAEDADAIPRAFVDLDRFPFVTADEYLSGNVRRKLRMAKALQEVLPAEKKAIVAPNIQALEAVQPVDLTAAEIGVRIGANWVPIEVYQKFMYELLGTNYYARSRIHILRSAATGQWTITEKTADRANVKAFSTYGTKRMSAYHILEQTLNQKDVRVFDYVEDEHGNRKPVLNKKETAIAQDRQELIRQKFSEWIWRDIDRREQLCKIYNETFNSIRPREYDGRHIRFSGMNPEISLRPHQINAIAHIMYGGNTLLAHEVGAGKSATRS